MCPDVDDHRVAARRALRLPVVTALRRMNLLSSEHLWGSIDAARTRARRRDDADADQERRTECEGERVERRRAKSRRVMAGRRPAAATPRPTPRTSPTILRATRDDQRARVAPIAPRSPVPAGLRDSVRQRA